MAKKKQSDRTLGELVGDLRETQDRLWVVLTNIAHFETLLESIENNHPNVKGIAEVCRTSMNRIKEAMG